MDITNINYNKNQFVAWGLSETNESSNIYFGLYPALLLSETIFDIKISGVTT